MAVISFCIRSAIPGYMVDPPDKTVLAYRSFLMSMSHFMIELKHPSWIPTTSIPKKRGGTSPQEYGNARCRQSQSVRRATRMTFQ